MQLPGILIDLNRVLVSDQPLYLVGGAVRDFLLGRPCRDYDLVAGRDVCDIAHRFADQTHAAIYTLDGERKMYRVLLGQETAQPTMVDFATLQGDTIEADLARRDFTINAMAVDLDAPERIIDPFKGGRDLQERFLRPVSEKSFSADPLRVIRALRYAVDLDLKLETATAGMIRAAAPPLAEVSKERKRDELFRILDGRNVRTGLSLMQRFLVFEYLPLQVSDDFSSVLNESRVLEELLGWLTGGRTIEKQASFHQVALFVQLGRFKEKIQEHFLAENTSGRTRKALLYLSLLTGIEQRGADKVIFENLALSSDELRVIEDHHNGYSVCRHLFESHAKPTPVDIYDYYQVTGASGVDLVIASLAGYRARIGVEFSHDEWLRRLGIAECLLDAWCEQPDIVHPESLLNGNEIMQVGKLSPGPIIGEALNALIHQQLAGMVTTKKQAVDWLAQWLTDKQLGS